MDGHMGLANSLALQKAGITRETKDPPGGTLTRTADGGTFQVYVDSYFFEYITRGEVPVWMHI